MSAMHKAVVGWTLMLAMATTASPLYAQAAGKLDVAYVVPEAVFGAVVFPGRIVKSPMLQQMGPMLGPMMLKAKGDLGFDPIDVEQIQMVVSLPPSPGEEPSMGMVIRLSKAYEADKVLPKLTEKTAEGEIDGKKYRKAKTAKDVSVHMPDDRTVLMGHDPMLRAMLANHGKPAAGRLSGVFGRFDDSNDVLAILLVDALRPLIKAQAEKEPPPAEMADAVKLPELIDTLGLKINLSNQAGMVLDARCPDEAAATEAERIINALLDMGKESMTKEMAAKPGACRSGRRHDAADAAADAPRDRCHAARPQGKPARSGSADPVCQRHRHGRGHDAPGDPGRPRGGAAGSSR